MIRELPPKGSAEALTIQQEQEEKQAQAMAGNTDGQEQGILSQLHLIRISTH